jgi:hypothetical protein
VIRKTFGPHADEALAVARCESNLHTWATGAAGERGLFQIHPTWASKFDWHHAYLPRVNARFAYYLSRGGTDWSHWTCQPY